MFDGDDYVAAFYGPDAKLDAQAHRSADGKAGTMYQRLINGLDPGKTFRSLSGSVFAKHSYSVYDSPHQNNRKTLTCRHSNLFRSR